ncbi:MAG: 1-acyl-sn-glycerol-3-phosphate acyltransferase [Polaromonas sp.]|nr:1-acyl-sn-glycerol-3-phosphate acyltransferase [Polaromonas sp.]
MTLLRVLWKALRAAMHVAHGFWIIKMQFPGMIEADQQRRVENWSAGLLQIASIELVVTGEPPSRGPRLLVANHISWLDIVVMHAARHCRFVSKSDVRAWPFVGTLADGGGTLYVERQSRRDAHRVVGHMAERLKAGDILAVFPEGTTSDGRDLKPFHANLLQAALDAAVPVQAVSLMYVEAASGQLSVAPSYIDDDTLVGSIWQTLSAPPLRAMIVFGEPQTAAGRGRREWAEDLRRDIAHQRKR